jgi:hypothetical protein
LKQAGNENSQAGSASEVEFVRRNGIRRAILGECKYLHLPARSLHLLICLVETTAIFVFNFATVV